MFCVLYKYASPYNVFEYSRYVISFAAIDISFSIEMFSLNYYDLMLMNNDNSLNSETPRSAEKFLCIFIICILSLKHTVSIYIVCKL